MRVERQRCRNRHRGGQRRHVARHVARSYCIGMGAPTHHRRVVVGKDVAEAHQEHSVPVYDVAGHGGVIGRRVPLEDRRRGTSGTGH